MSNVWTLEGESVRDGQEEMVVEIAVLLVAVKRIQVRRECTGEYTLTTTDYRMLSLPGTSSAIILTHGPHGNGT